MVAQHEPTRNGGSTLSRFNAVQKGLARTGLSFLGAILMMSSFASGVASGAPHSRKPTLYIADVQTFTGSTAGFGPDSYAGCHIAVTLINKAGGVLGHDLACKIVDTRSDVVDSVPGVEKLVSVTHGVVGVYGPSSTTASADVPIINSAHIPMFADTGSTEFTHKFYKYFYRIIPADDAVGYAEAIWAHKQGYKKIALLYVNDTSDEGSVPGIIAGAKALGMKIVSNQPVPADQTNYDTEIEAMLGKHPTVIIGTVDPQTGATMMKNVEQLNGGKLIPFVNDETVAQPVWLKALEGAIGKADYMKYFRSVVPVAGVAGRAYHVYAHAMLSSNYSEKQHWATDAYAQAPYDSVNYLALAMLEAHSTSPAVYAPYIVKIANPGKGKVIVHTFAEGKKAIEHGHKIRYEGVFQDVVFNRFHDSSGNYVVNALKPPAKVIDVATITSQAVASLSAKTKKK